VGGVGVALEVLEADAMHQMFFGVKRVHLLNLRLSRLLLRDFWEFDSVTPARFDMLRIVHVYDVEGVSVAQGSIRELLGVSGATVSRMLKALEGLGYIVRERKKWRPGLHVSFTDSGRALVKRLMARCIEDASIDAELDEMMEPEQYRLAAFDELLLFFRGAYQDPARFPNPWRCGGLNVEWQPYWGLRCA
jgi:DNA-binding MarR family transcriptional regulator